MAEVMKHGVVNACRTTGRLKRPTHRANPSACIGEHIGHALAALIQVDCSVSERLRQLFCQWDGAAFPRLRVFGPKLDYPRPQVHAVPGQAQNFTLAHTSMIGREIDGLEVSGRYAYECLELAGTEYAIPLVSLTFLAHTGRRVASRHATFEDQQPLDRHIEHALETSQLPVQRRWRRSLAPPRYAFPAPRSILLDDRRGDVGQALPTEVGGQRSDAGAITWP